MIKLHLFRPDQLCHTLYEKDGLSVIFEKEPDRDASVWQRGEWWTGKGLRIAIPLKKFEEMTETPTPPIGSDINVCICQELGLIGYFAT